MKIKKIIIFILAMLVIFSVPTSYAKDAVPAANASKAEIEKYIKNNGTDKVSIDTLCKWYNTVGSDTSLVQTVIKGLQNKSKSDINTYCKNKTSDQLRSSIPYSGILKSWMNTVATDSELEKKISEAYSAEQKEAKEKTDNAELTYRTISPDDFEPAEDTSTNQKALAKAGKVVGAIQAIGNIVSIGALIVIGIKYMIGSVDERAEYKKTMLPYLIGAILVFSGANVVQLIYNVI